MKIKAFTPRAQYDWVIARLCLKCLISTKNGEKLLRNLEKCQTVLLKIIRLICQKWNCQVLIDINIVLYLLLKRSQCF